MQDPIAQGIPPASSDSLTAAASEVARALADSLQIEFLKTINEQLGPWSNPYGLMVAALGVLFAIGALVAGLLLWRQGKEYRELIEGEIQKYREVMDGLVATKLSEFATSTAALRSQIEGETGDARHRLEKQLKDLEDQSERFHNYIEAFLWAGRGPFRQTRLGDLLSGRFSVPLSGSGEPITGIGSRQVQRRCPACDHAWLAPTLNAVSCPSCGHQVPCDIGRGPR